MKGIISVLGKDSVGIIAKTCSYMSDNNVNILDISQTIVQDYFSMIMIVDITNSNKPFEKIAEGLQEIAQNLGVSIKLQHEDIFNSMHRI